MSMLVTEDGSVCPTYENDFPDTKQEAILHSVEKYEWLLGWCKVNKEKSLPGFGARSCALCNLYIQRGCTDCPVYAKTRSDYCEDTPYDKLQYKFNTPITDEVIELIEDEIAFLKSLK